MNPRKRALPTVWVLAGMLLATPIAAQNVELEGKWATRLGVIRVKQDGKKVSGKLIWVSKTCPFKRGTEILKGVLLEDSLSGKWRYCLKGDKCSGNKWAPMVMLVARAGRVLSGAAYYKSTECVIGGKRKGDGVVVRKLRPRPKKPKPAPGEVAVKEPVVAPNPTGFVDEDGQELEEEIKPLNPKDFEKNAGDWRSLMEEGSGYMNAGFFERARRYFHKATKLDPTKPEAFNGIGVTYYARNDYQEALKWYKRSLEVNPDFGDAFYNMACIYSLMKKRALAFRYLNIAVLNGYAQHEAMQQDGDLKNIRGDERYQKILDRMRKR